MLSACDTRVGVVRSSALASLQRALHMAGARKTITSLWTVSDVAARELMLDFYHRLRVDGQPVAEALWAAKLSLRSRYPKSEWAGWVLTGNPD